MTVILCHVTLPVGEVGVVCRRHGHPVADRVAANDEAAGVNAGSTDGTLKHPRVFYGVALPRIHGAFRLAKLRRALDGIGEIHLHAVGQAVGNGFLQLIGARQWQLLHSRHVGNGVFRRHARIGNDMRAIVLAILVHYPLQDLSATVIIEVGIDIREVDTVRVEETLKKQVVF